MGTYVNPGNEAFQEALNSRIYIDKSKLISYTNIVLNTNQKTCASAAHGALENLWQRICWWLITAKAVIPQDYLPG